jgi:uncharacterized membrane protein
MTMALLAMVGLMDAIYLQLARYQTSSMACPVTGDGCTTVRDSAWSVFPPAFLGVPSIPISLLGIAGYVLLLAVPLMALYRDQVAGLSLPLVQVVLGSVGFGVVVYLVSVQAFAVQAYCFWCLLSSLITTAIWLLALYDWRQQRSGDARRVSAPGRARQAH